VRLRVLGQCEVEFRGQTVPFRHKVAELLGLLVVRRGPVTRAELAATLWPDAFDTNARHNLRQTLLTVRNRVGDGNLLIIDVNAVSLAPPVEVDLWERTARWECDPSPDDFVGLSPFLAPLHVDWIVAQQSDLDRRAVEMALRRGEMALKEDPRRALAFARSAIQTVCNLVAPRQLAVRAYLALGDTEYALREIEEFETVLSKEFGGAKPHRLRALLQPALPLDFRQANLGVLSPVEVLSLVLATLPALMERPSQTHSVLREALDGAPDAPPDSRARAEVEVARLAMAGGDVFEAEASIARAKELTSSPLLRARADTIWGRVLARTNRLPEAREVLEKTLEVARKHGAFDLIAEAEGALGACAIMEHRTADAEVILRRALVAAERAGNRDTIARILQNRATALMYSGRLDAAEAELARGLEVAPPWSRALIAMNLGRVRHMRGDWTEAERAYGEAAEALRDDPYHLAQALTYVGDCALRRGDLGRSHAAYAEAVALRRTIGDRLGLMTAYKGLGTISHREGKLAAAEGQLREALRFSLEIEEPMGGASVRVALARVLAHAGRIREALAEAKRARSRIVNLRAEANALTWDDTLSLEAVDALVKKLESGSQA
jgi:tetratricopeptide (TPR) repeat protein